MRPRDLEGFHKKIFPTIKIATDYLQYPLFPKLVRDCRLKPYSIIGNFKINKLDYLWFDEFGNSIDITDQYIKIILNDPRIKISRFVSTDLFYGLSITNTLKISKSIGFGSDHFILYGEDEYFRCFRIKDGIKVSSLECGIEILNKIYMYRNLKYKEINEDWSIYKLPNPDINRIIEEYNG